MEITEIQVDGYEKVVRCRDQKSGLHALIAVHDTTLGPSLGGMRMWPYASEDEALFDVLRLSKGMTYKSAVAETGDCQDNFYRPVRLADSTEFDAYIR